MASSPHFWRGDIALAFMFSAPGDEERRQGRPVAGDTGTNLELALGHLHSALPMLFRSVHRYDYRITNDNLDGAVEQLRAIVRSLLQAKRGNHA